jgi:flagellar secretion chaperone FliS
MWNDKELTYRKSAIQGASTIGLVIALYDTLSGDFRRAASAIRADNIERRCAELNHAALVLGQLENWVDVNSGEELAQNLVVFYGYLRAKMLEASLQKSAPILEELIELILQVRGAWQQRDAGVAQPVAVGAMQTFGTSSTMGERIAFSV